MRLFSPKKERIVEIDFIRGVLIIFMMVDHFFYDFTSFGALQVIFNKIPTSLMNTADWYWSWDVRIVTRFIILSTFFLISGISCYFSKNNLKRGILLSIVGALLSVGFTVFSKIMKDSSMSMFFGAISSFGLSVLIYTLLKFIYDLIFKDNKKFFKYILLILGGLSIWLGISFKVFTRSGPEYTDLSWSTFIGIIAGKYQPGGADWLPLFPYIGFMFIGAALGEILYEQRISYFFPLPKKVEDDAPMIKKIGFYSLYPYKGLKTAICFSGKYSLFFYILHQPVIILLCSLILLMLGYKIQL